MSSGPATARRRTNARVRREEARERILAAAENLLLERPYRDITVEQVMAGAGLSRTVFYRHFDGLPDVLLTLLRMIEGELVAPMLAPVTDAETWLRELLAGGVDTFAGTVRSCERSTTPPARTRRSRPRIPQSSTASSSRRQRRLDRTSERTRSPALSP